MDYLSSLPIDMVRENCNKLDYRSLFRYMQTSKRTYKICSDILEKRRQEHMQELLEKEVNDLFSGKDPSVYYTGDENNPTSIHIFYIIYPGVFFSKSFGDELIIPPGTGSGEDFGGDYEEFNDEINKFENKLIIVNELKKRGFTKHPNGSSYIENNEKANALYYLS